VKELFVMNSEREDKKEDSRQARLSKTDSVGMALLKFEGVSHRGSMFLKELEQRRGRRE